MVRFEVTALLDGHLDLDLALFPGAAGAAETSALLDRAFLPRRVPIRIPVVAFAVNTGERLYLIDAGSPTGFLPGLAPLPAALASGRARPKKVDSLLLMHLPPDHIGRAVLNGQPLFPNAELVMAEAKFWLDAGVASRAPAEVQPFFATSRAGAAPFTGRTRLLGTGAQVVVPDVEAVPPPGHTPGWSGPHQTGHAAWLADCWAMNSRGERMRKPE